MIPEKKETYESLMTDQSYQEMLIFLEDGINQRKLDDSKKRNAYYHFGTLTYYKKECPVHMIYVEYGIY